MSKKADLVTVANTYDNTGQINTNFEEVNNALENTVSLDGSTPNAMNADFDLNGNDILNAENIDTKSLSISGFPAGSLETAFKWSGDWATATDYQVNEVVQEGGSSYICVVAHTSSFFPSDLALGHWDLMAKIGDSGSGTGDMLKSNNLSDVDDVPTSRINLGLGTILDTQDTQTWIDGTSTTETLVSPDKVDAKVSDSISKIPTQDQSTWDAGVSTEESLISPAKLISSIEANTPEVTPATTKVYTTSTTGSERSFPVDPENGFTVKLVGANTSTTSDKQLWIAFSSNNGGNYGSNVVIKDVPTSEGFEMDVVVDKVTGSGQYTYNRPGSGASFERGTFTVPSAGETVNRVRFSSESGQLDYALFAEVKYVEIIT